MKAGGSSTLKVEPVCSSEMQVHFQQTMQHYIPEAVLLKIALFTITKLILLCPQLNNLRYFPQSLLFSASQNW
jgi:hypothetical protein